MTGFFSILQEGHDYMKCRVLVVFPAVALMAMPAALHGQVQLPPAITATAMTYESRGFSPGCVAYDRTSMVDERGVIRTQFKFTSKCSRVAYLVHQEMRNFILTRSAQLVSIKPGETRTFAARNINYSPASTRDLQYWVFENQDRGTFSQPDLRACKPGGSRDASQPCPPRAWLVR